MTGRDVAVLAVCAAVGAAVGWWAVDLWHLITATPTPDDP